MPKRKPAEPGVPIYDLRIGQCRFAITPFEATQHRFCAEPVEYAGCPYCAVHAPICFDRRSEARRREDAAVAKILKMARAA